MFAVIRTLTEAAKSGQTAGSIAIPLTITIVLLFIVIALTLWLDPAVLGTVFS